jgi:heme/copper-type cytochrome/quinol oxidase subunit 2
MSSSTSRRATSSATGPSLLLLWLGVLGPPLIYLFDLQASYTLANRACSSGSHALYALTTAAAALLVSGIGIMSWTHLQSLSGYATMEGAREPDRNRFLALGGVAFSAGFLLLILGNFVPKFILGVCD